MKVDLQLLLEIHKYLEKYPPSVTSRPATTEWSMEWAQLAARMDVLVKTMASKIEVEVV
jgi:hypothetical protein